MADAKDQDNSIVRTSFSGPDIKNAANGGGRSGLSAALKGRNAPSIAVAPRQTGSSIPTAVSVDSRARHRDRPDNRDEEHMRRMTEELERERQVERRSRGTSGKEKGQGMEFHARDGRHGKKEGEIKGDERGGLRSQMVDMGMQGGKYVSGGSGSFLGEAGSSSLSVFTPGSYGSFGSFDGIISPMSSSRFFVGARGLGRPNRSGQPPSIIASSPMNRAQGTDVIIVPSQTVDPRELEKIKGVVHYEERSLFPALLLLRNPSTRIAFLSSMPTNPEVIDYYLEIIATPRQYSSFRKRCLLVSCNDSDSRALSSKLLERKDIIEQVRKWIRPGQAHMRCIISTKLEVDLAAALGVPLLANDPQFSHLGTKHGSRYIFEKAKVPLPDGIPEVFNEKDLVAGIEKLWLRNPKQRKIVIKLNEGISGEGNVVFPLYKLHDHLTKSSEERQKYIQDMIVHLRYHEKDNYLSFKEKIEQMGAIVECWIEGEDLTSPSGQATVTPDGDVQLLSTHEQLLNGQEYQGCLFPAEDKYRDLVHKYTLKIGKALAAEGGRERFSVDYIAVRRPGKPKTTTTLHDDEDELILEEEEEEEEGMALDVSVKGGQNLSVPSQPHSNALNLEDQEEEDDDDDELHEWQLYAIEINLRNGGTTYPYETTRLLVGGKYGQTTGLLQSHEEKTKCYRATDNLCSEHFKSLTIADLRRIIRGTSAEWDHDKDKGCVFHFIGAMQGYGKLGIIAVGDSPDEVDEIFEDASETLFREAKRHSEKLAAAAKDDSSVPASAATKTMAETISEALPKKN